MTVLRQQLFAEDSDEISTVYVDILEDLYKGKLSDYEGRSALSTWLVLVSRGKALDYLRRKRGRKRLPKGFERLDAFDRRVFQLHYVEGLSLEVLMATLDWNGEPASVDRVAESIQRIEAEIDGRYLKRLRFDHQARANGIDSGRLLEYFLHVKAEYHRGTRISAADRALIEEEREAVLERVAALRGRLPETERAVLALRFDRGLSAREISRELGVESPRRVYAIIEAAVKRLREALIAEGIEPTAHDW